MPFTQEELEALYTILSYASESISSEDEPLLDILFEKIKILLDNKQND
jgi:hypothetical protein